MARVRDIRDALRAMEGVKGTMKPTTRFRIATVMSEFRRVVDNYDKAQQGLVSELAAEDGTLPAAEALEYSKQLNELLDAEAEVTFRPVKYALIEKADMTPAQLEAMLRAGVVVETEDEDEKEAE